MVTSVTVDNCFLVQRVSETVITLNLVLLVNQKVVFRLLTTVRFRPILLIHASQRTRWNEIGFVTQALGGLDNQYALRQK